MCKSSNCANSLIVNICIGKKARMLATFSLFMNQLTNQQRHKIPDH